MKNNLTIVANFVLIILVLQLCKSSTNWLSNAWLKGRRWFNVGQCRWRLDESSVLVLFARRIRLFYIFATIHIFIFYMIENCWRKSRKRYNSVFCSFETLFFFETTLNFALAAGAKQAVYRNLAGSKAVFYPSSTFQKAEIQMELW